MKRLKKILIALALAVALCFGAFNIYALDYYRAEDSVMAALTGTDRLNIYSTEDMVVFQPQNPVAGFIFYPGGKVDCTAYAPLMKQLAENDLLCVITPMPYNLAVLDINAADGIKRQFPQVTDWYIGGHSLGGSMAASFVADNSAGYSGLVLLAAYSTADLTASGLQVLSIYGSEDTVLNSEKYAEYLPNLPRDMAEIVIDGGNHAQFGNYGLQDGDGNAAITARQQQTQTVTAIMSMIEK